MELATQLDQQLQRLAGFTSGSPHRVELADDEGNRLTVDFVAVDTLSCAFLELLLHVPKLVGHELGVLKQWASNLSKRVTYLLENIGPVEIDQLGDQILIRSTPPDRSSTATKFYEVLLSAKANGTFSLRRIVYDHSQSTRQGLDIQLTHEVVLKLVRDLLSTVPA